MTKWKIKDDNNGVPVFQFVVYEYQHPNTKLWQLGITFDGNDINWVAAYLNPDRVDIYKQEIKRHIPVGEPFQKQKALALLEKFYEEREADPQPIPQHLERMYLLNTVWRK